MQTRKSSSVSLQRSITLLLLFVAGLVNFFDRASLSVANTTIAAEMHWNATRMGWLLSSFSLAYGLAQLPLLPLVQRFGTKRVLGGGLGLWSAAQMLTGLVLSFGPFVALRVLLGTGEAPFYPCGIQVVRDSFAPETRARATAFMSMSQTLALAAAPPALSLLMLHMGWRWMFMALGVAGLSVALAWMRWHVERVSAPTSGQGSAARQSIWKKLLRFRTMWGMMLGWSGINYTVWLYTAWVPGYLQTSRHLGIARSGWIAAIPFLFGAAGMASSGLFSDWRVRKGTRLSRVHRANLILGMVLSAAGTFAVGRSETTAAAVAGISAALFFVHFAGTSGWGYVQTIGGQRYAASAGALMNFASFIIASAAPVLTGWLLDRTRSFTFALEICSAVMLLGALSYATLGKPPRGGTFEAA